MKQSFEVFEQSDGVALHLTVTVDSDALPVGASCTQAVRGLSRSSSSARKGAHAACMNALATLPTAVRQAIVASAISADEENENAHHRSGARDRQPEVDALNATIEGLKKEVVNYHEEANKLTAQLLEAKRATRKATRK